MRIPTVQRLWALLYGGYCVYALLDAVSVERWQPLRLNLECLWIETATNGGIYAVPRVWPCAWALRGMGVDALMAALFNLYNLFG
jgi:hypothetical protein